MGKTAPVKSKDLTWAVYRHDQYLKSKPHCVVTKDVALEWLACKYAINMGSHRIVLKKPGELQLRDESCRISGLTMYKALAGSKHHQALIQACMP